MGDIQQISSWIGGQEAPEGGPSFENHNPATGELLSRVEAATEALVDRAVQSAADALPAWRSRSGAERGRILTAAAAALRARNDELARLEVLDVGKPLAEARAVDVASAADCLEYFGGLAASLQGHHVDLGESAFGYTRREPLGVCAGIGPGSTVREFRRWRWPSRPARQRVGGSPTSGSERTVFGSPGPGSTPPRSGPRSAAVTRVL